MKKVKWDKCEYEGAIGTYRDNSPIMTNQDDVLPGMCVAATYNGVNLELIIEKETCPKPDQIFKAKVHRFTSDFGNKILNIKEGDCVEIDRDHICWLTD